MQKWKTIILLLIIFIQTVKSKNENLSLTVTDGNRIIDILNMVLYHKNLPQNSEIKFEITGKIVYLYHFGKLPNILDKYQNFYNNRWIFLIDNIITWIQMVSYIDKYNPGNFYAFVWSENLKDVDFSNKNYPVFISNKDNFDRLKKYNIENESGNYFLNIKYDNYHADFPTRYLLIISIICAAYCLIMVIIWHYINYKKYGNYIMTLQKALTSLPYIKLILSLLIIYYISVSSDASLDTLNSLVKVYLETIVTTLTSIFKTIFWFLIIMISCGWQIYRFLLTRIEMRRFIGLYVFIYISVCFDQIIDLMINKRIWNFEVSELKNFVIYSILTGVAFYHTKKSINFIRTKTYYSSILAPEYLPSLMLKMRMLYLHIIVVISFTVLYISSVVTQKILFPRYSNPLLSLVNNQSMEIIALTFYLLIFRGRKFPTYYTINYYSDDINKNGKIYSVEIPQIAKLLSSGSINDFGLIQNSKKKKMKFDEAAPYIIINPIFREDAEIINSNNEINRNESLYSVMSVNKHTSTTDKLSVGFRKNV